ncbi:sugar phosphate isomerase/epimerase family protein [Nocardioides yefusunii]|uniref:Sugar phosphate isomerase/epimerase family protein n=1 Tax=Nocardioides yefusunii TaxID=2500546 RepID=A0ABW1R064_9ACTN|nr:sugar phosphate isomerase/epimerase [Nocardioides yefusunii]
MGLSTISVFPESTAAGFGYAAELGYDSVEVMVGMDRLAQQASALAQLVDHHQMPVSAVHAPCLLWTQRVWGTEPWGKLERSAKLAQVLGAPSVVVHPPFRWQKEYAAGFAGGIARLEDETGIDFCVENMYPWRATARGRDLRGMEMYLPHWDTSLGPYAHTTIDVSHAAIAGDDVIAMAERMGSRLQHIHLTDGTGSAKDEHLVPGRGHMQVDAFLRHLVATGFDGNVVVEITTRKADSREERLADLRESLEFAREHLGLVRT